MNGAAFWLLFPWLPWAGSEIECRQVRFQGDLQSLRTSLMIFEAINGRPPSNSEGLAALVSNPDPRGLPHWQQLISEVPRDPWNHPYVYVAPSPDGKAKFGIYSLGADGISRSQGNDADDINSWSATAPPAPPPAWRFGHYAPWLLGAGVFGGVLLWRFSSRRNHSDAAPAS